MGLEMAPVPVPVPGSIPLSRTRTDDSQHWSRLLDQEQLALTEVEARLELTLQRRDNLREQAAKLKQTPYG